MSNKAGVWKWANLSTSYPLQLAAVFAAYALTGEIGLATPFTSGNVSPVWPASGVALAAILLFGYRIAPAIFAGAFVINYFSSIPHTAAAGLAAGNTCAAIAGAYLLHLLPGFERSLARMRDALGLILLAAVAASMVSASIGTAVLFGTEVKPWADVTSAWFVYWVGDAMGVILVAPLLLTWKDLRRVGEKRRLLEGLLLGAVLFFVCKVIFAGGLLQAPESQLFAFAVFPFVMWAAIRFGVSGAALASLVIAHVAISSTVQGSGPFAKNTAFVNASLLQIYLGVLSISGMLLAAVLAEREDLVREQSAAEARLQLAAIVESSDDAIFSARLDGTIVSWNSGAERLYGFSPEEAIGKSLGMLIPEERMAEFESSLLEITSGKTIRQFETVRKRKDGSLFDVSLSISPIRNISREVVGAAAIARDITERKLAEEALRRADKLATTGRLAATIAHEINNPLESLTNLLYLISSHPSLDDSAKKYAVNAEEELRRTSYITRQMLSFHRSVEKPVVVSMPDLLDGVLEMYGPVISRKGIKVGKDYERGSVIAGIPAELTQVFANLLRNAIEAVEQGGVIRIRVRRTRDWRKPERTGVRVIVADSGRGVEAEVRSKIFDPFFTTKGESGTGLGLWVGLGIIQKREGAMRFKSSTKTGRSGTVFSVFLPSQTDSIVAAESGNA